MLLYDIVSCDTIFCSAVQPTQSSLVQFSPVLCCAALCSVYVVLFCPCGALMNWKGTREERGGSREGREKRKEKRGNSEERRKKEEGRREKGEGRREKGEEREKK